LQYYTVRNHIIAERILVVILI
ncbi:cysteine protease, YopT-type domain protein, partial [Escherichia coli 6.0172]